jgi:hypothetical protein
MPEIDKPSVGGPRGPRYGEQAYQQLPFVGG